MHRAFTTIILGTGFLLGCRTDRYFRDFDSGYYWGTNSMLAVGVPPDVVCQDANNTSLDRRRRCETVAQLFGTFVRPGITTERMHAALPDTRWLDSCSLELVGGIGGYIPIAHWLGHSVFIVRLFPDASGWSDWVIYFALPHAPGSPLAREEAIAFLRGRHPDGRLRLAEFAICYPHIRSLPGGGTTSGTTITERFTERGVGLAVN